MVVFIGNLPYNPDHMRRLDQDPIPYDEKIGNFFNTASIGDIYKRDVPNPRRIPLTDEQFSRWILNVPEGIDARAERVAYARSKGIQWIDELNVHRYPITSREGPYYLTETPAPHLTHWFPYIEERRVILDLAKVLASTNKPTILEAGCGSGIVSKVLAIEDNVDVVGVDPDMVKMGSERIPSTPGSVQFKQTDLWNVIDEFGPEFSQDVISRRKALLDTVRAEYSKKPIFELFCLGSACAQEGDPQRVENEVRELQELARTAERPSPIDIVLCSFMPRDIDLTVPLRDGIYPKTIIYMRPVSGMSGAGDFYVEGIFDRDTGEEIIPNDNAAISFNPGSNYRTIARWLTPCSNDWWYFNKPSHFYERFETEVVIQVRKDIQIKGSGDIDVNKYPFDDDFVQGFKKPELYRQFREGLESARSELFQMFSNSPS